jgi:hypothetical protein
MTRALLLLLTVLPACAQIDEARLLAAIRQTEDSYTVGQRGEIGPYQMTPANVAHYGGSGYDAAMALLRDNATALPRIGMPVSEWTCALAWCEGITRLEHRQISNRAVTYAKKVRAAYFRQQPKSNHG